MAEPTPPLGIDHIYHWTRDMDRAVRFYSDVLGLQLAHRAGNGWAAFAAGPIRLALHGTEETTAPAGGTVVFRVDDLDEARSALRRRGVIFDGPEAEVPGVGRFATFHDPDGNPLQLIEYR